MKLMKVLIVIGSLTTSAGLLASMKGSIKSTTEYGPASVYDEQHYYVDQMDYVNGGVTFNYPANWFSEAPMIRVSIELKNATYSSSEHITCCVTTNSASSTTVRVNKGAGDSVVEAATDDVVVHIHAVGDV